MELTEIVTALVLVGLSSHLAIQHRRGLRQERRDAALRHLGELSRHMEVFNESRPANDPSAHAFDFSHYYVPVGLRIEQARRVIHKTRER